MVARLTCQQYMVKTWIWDVTLFLVLLILLHSSKTHESHRMILKTSQNVWKNVVYFLFVLYQCYASWLVFGASFFHFQQRMHFVGHWFHQLLYDFHLNVVPFLLLLLPKVALASGHVFTESRAPIHLILEVFDRIHVRGLWTQWQYCDCIIVEAFDWRPSGILCVIIMLDPWWVELFIPRMNQCECNKG